MLEELKAVSEDLGLHPPVRTVRPFAEEGPHLKPPRPVVPDGMKCLACFLLPLDAAVNTSPRRIDISLKISDGEVVGVTPHPAEDHEAGQGDPAQDRGRDREVEAGCAALARIRAVATLQPVLDAPPAVDRPRSVSPRTARIARTVIADCVRTAWRLFLELRRDGLRQSARTRDERTAIDIEGVGMTRRLDLARVERLLDRVGQCQHDDQKDTPASPARA